MGTEENLGLNSGYVRTQQWVHKDSTVGTEENLGLNSGYVRTQQWVHKDSTVGTEENLGLNSVCGREHSTQLWLT